MSSDQALKRTSPKKFDKTALLKTGLERQPGALSLKKSRSEGRAQLSALFDEVENISHRDFSPPGNQLVLI